MVLNGTDINLKHHFWFFRFWLVGMEVADVRRLQLKGLGSKCQSATNPAPVAFQFAKCLNRVEIFKAINPSCLFVV